MAAGDPPRVIEKIETKTEKTEKKEDLRPVPVPTTVEPPRPEERIARKEERLPKEDRAALKLSKKERKRIKDSHRPLDSWERYRALSDTLDEALDLVDLADHKARFAMIIMTAINGVLFILSVRGRTDFFELVPEQFRTAMGAVVLLYGLTAVYFFLQAIESLRPRKSKPQVQYMGESMLEDYPMGIRYYEDILSRDVEAYRRAWREVRMGQLNAELAIQAHALAQINRAKYAALRRLYLGLQIMTIMAAGMLGVAAYFAFSTRSGGVEPGQKEKGKNDAAIFGAPDRLPGVGAREPSGVAFHPRTGHLFVAGDEGRLAEIEREGRLVRSHPVRGDLEDVAVHTPSGNLLLISERKYELILYDPVTSEEKKRWHLAPEDVLGESPGEKNQGFEGLAFLEDAQAAGGGVVYLTHQRSPATVVGIAFDPLTAPSGPLGGDVVVSRWPLEGYQDLTAATYVPELQRLLVIADAKDELLVVNARGVVEHAFALPGEQQEGLCFDDRGDLWVADDRGALLRFSGALATLKSRLSGGAAAPHEQERQGEGRRLGSFL